MIEKTAIFSPCRTYRYTLSRIWLRKKPYACFVCLNPSTADKNKDDPTIRRCIRFSESWGYGGLYMVNIFALRSTDPKKLYTAKDPTGPDNDQYLRNVSDAAGITIAAWGAHGAHLNRAQEVIRLLRSPYYLALTKGNHPRHPLYLRKTLKPVKLFPTPSKETP